MHASTISRPFISRPFISRPFALFLTVLLTLGGMALFPEKAEAAPPAVRVVANVANVRNGPGTNYRVVNQVRRGAVLNVIGRSRGWVQVKRPGGSATGWISESLLVRVR